MFKEVLLITPKLATDAMNAMEAALNTRFVRVAKKFGKGLVGVLTGGGIAGLALGLIDKLLNPLKETQEAIDRVLKQGDDIVVQAKQFGTTAGKLMRLQALAQANGLEPGSMMILLEKFQTAVAEAQQDPTKDTSVRQFVGQKDMAEAFFTFMQNLQKLDPTQRTLVQQEVFGEKQILKMAEFMQADFAKALKELGGPAETQLTAAATKLSNLEGLQQQLAATRGLEDLVGKSKVINESMVRSQDAQAKQAQEKEDKRIRSYDDLAKISMAADNVLALGQTVINKLTALAVEFTDLSNNVKKLTESRAVKGFLNLLGGK